MYLHRYMRFTIVGSRGAKIYLNLKLHINIAKRIYFNTIKCIYQKSLYNIHNLFYLYKIIFCGDN